MYLCTFPCLSNHPVWVLGTTFSGRIATVEPSLHSLLTLFIFLTYDPNASIMKYFHTPKLTRPPNFSVMFLFAIFFNIEVNLNIQYIFPFTVQLLQMAFNKIFNLKDTEDGLHVCDPKECLWSWIIA